MDAAILSIGDELALGQTVDTNTAWLAGQLAHHGVSTQYHFTVADDLPRIVDALKLACRDHQLVLVTGGLGPTADDLTREAIAQLLGEPLQEDAAAVAVLEQFFAGRGRPMPARNKVQACRPASAAFLENPNGTAPGLTATVDGATLYAMPGVPREMRAMYQQHVEPTLTAAGGGGASGGGGKVIRTARVHTFGIGESDAAERLGELMDRQRNPKVGTTISGGTCSARVRSEATDADTAAEQLEDTVRRVGEAIGPVVFGRDDDTLASVLLELMRQRGLKLAVAESCTGGMLGQMLTEPAGSSDVFVGGWVVYSNAMKTRQLGVPESVIEQHGAVSGPVVEAMATAALQQSQADTAIAISGVAGPGHSEGKPAGTVWIGLARRVDGGPQVQSRVAKLGGGRDAVRLRSSLCAMQLLRLWLLGESLDEVTWATPGSAKAEAAPA